MTLATGVTDEVRRLLSALGMSQTQLARAAQIPPSLIHRALKGDRELTLTELDRVARVLGVTPEHLVQIGRTRAAPHPPG